MNRLAYAPTNRDQARQALFADACATFNTAVETRRRAIGAPPE